MKHKPAKLIGKGSEFPEPVAINTVLGRFKLVSDWHYAVALGEESFAGKGTGVISRGDTAFLPLDKAPRSMTRTLVNAALAEEPLYMATTRELYVRRDNRYTTAFRDELLLGLASCGEVWPAENAENIRLVEAIMAGKSVELTTKQANDAAVFIHSTLVAALGDGANFNVVCTDHIARGWLGARVELASDCKDIGNLVVLPSQAVEVVKALSFAPGLNKLLSEEFRAAYNLYLDFRKGVMLRLFAAVRREGLPGIKNVEDGNCKPAKNPELQEKIRTIASRLLKRVGGYFEIEVLGVEHGAAACRGELFDGIATEADIRASSMFRQKSPQELRGEVLALRTICEKIISDFLFGKGEKNMNFSGIVMAVGFALGFVDDMESKHKACASRVRERFGNGIDRFLPPLSNFTPNATLQGIADCFIQKLYNGELDRRYGAKPGTMMALFDYFSKAHNIAYAERDFYKIFLESIIRKKTGEGASVAAEKKELEEISRKIETAERRLGPPTAIELVSDLCLAGKLRGGPIISGVPVKMDVREIVYHDRMTPAEILEKAYGRSIAELISEGKISPDEAALGRIRNAGFGHLEGLYPLADGSPLRDLLRSR
jgi:hypothetical protein